ncbi:hypothetical protein GF336_03985 [Candidatus Woesearchaeota archaeon]|nr:hypothetical protein [Candidatus Woesearchaeota archaeon]
MKKIDLLKKLYDQEISLDEAKDIYNKIMDYDNTQMKDLLCLSDVEFTALGGPYVDFDILAKWRYEGWPNKCIKCKEEIVVEKFGWVIKKTEQGKPVLCHVKCLKND